MIKLMQGDCSKVMADITDCSIDLTVTSPPYDNLRAYNGNNEQWGSMYGRRFFRSYTESLPRAGLWFG